jgi:hypothetical protein
MACATSQFIRVNHPFGEETIRACGLSKARLCRTLISDTVEQFSGVLRHWDIAGVGCHARLPLCRQRCHAYPDAALWADTLYQAQEPSRSEHQGHSVGCRVRGNAADDSLIAPRHIPLLKNPRTCRSTDATQSNFFCIPPGSPPRIVGGSSGRIEVIFRGVPADIVSPPSLSLIG